MSTYDARAIVVERTRAEFGTVPIGDPTAAPSAIAEVIAVAEFWDLDLTPADFRGTTVDGMDGWEWLDAMTMD